jgi:hypothetical protein
LLYKIKVGFEFIYPAAFPVAALLLHQLTNYQPREKVSEKTRCTEGQVVVSDGSHGASVPLIGVKGNKKSTKYWNLSQLQWRNQFKYRSCSNKMIGTLSIKQMIHYNYI